MRSKKLGKLDTAVVGELQVVLPPLSSRSVYAIYRKALRTGKYWKLLPEERAILRLAKNLNKIVSPLLREAIYKILVKIWPEKARYYIAVHEGIKALKKRAELAAKLEWIKLKEVLSKWRENREYVLQVGFSALNTSPFYRGEM